MPGQKRLRNRSAGQVLAGGVGLSLAANLAQDQPTAWARIVAAVPSAALLAVSMIERRAARRPPACRRSGRRCRPVRAGRPSPAQDEQDKALRRELAVCLRTGRAVCKPRRRADSRHGRIGGMVNISERAGAAADRAMPGHWEGDLIEGRDGVRDGDPPVP